MLNRFFPNSLDNNYSGYRIVIWLFVPLVLLRLVMGGNFMWHPYSVATTADAIPLASYTTPAANAVISLYAQIGLYHFLLALLATLVLIRYRTMMPLMYLLLLAELLASRLLDQFYPIAKPGVSSAQAGSALILGMLIVAFAGLVLSLLPRIKQPRI